MWPRIFGSCHRFRPVQTAPDLFADQFVHVNLSDVPGNGPCGAGELTVHPLHPNRAMQGKTLLAIFRPTWRRISSVIDEPKAITPPKRSRRILRFSYRMRAGASGHFRPNNGRLS